VWVGGRGGGRFWRWLKGRVSGLGRVGIIGSYGRVGIMGLE